ncbi:MAG: molybdate ABC transporter substrate-binding protein [Gammaproteobacteria bacterium]|nr:molybdate ABC transporter substrate-binding protein [Gammaproteobacteria bacterium]
MPGSRFLLAALLFAFLLPAWATRGEVRIAVAANFAPTLRALAEDFSAQTGHRVKISSGSSGKHYAQIRNGAGFDVFLAADSARPARLEAEGIGIAGSCFTYAIGRLVLWVPGQTRIDRPEDYLTSARFRRLAIANPRLAPYGLAAQQALETWQLWGRLQERLVRGENVAQAYQFVATGNAQSGLVALSQLLRGDRAGRGAYRIISGELHDPIRQDAVLLRSGAAAEAFLQYLRSEPAARMIRAAGYGLPGHS